MPWGKDGGKQGPWGRPGGMQGGSNGGGKRPPPPQGPDFDKWLRDAQDRVRRSMGGGGDRRNFLLLGGLAAAVLLIFNMVYFVGPDEQGVVMRFGQYHRSTPPGVGFHLPYPIETVRTPKVTSVNRVEIGFRSGSGRYSSVSSSAIPEESLMLTGDANIVDINFEVQWKIGKAEEFLFNVRNPEETVKAVAESVMREVVGRTPIAGVLAEEKLTVGQSVKKLMQDTLNGYGAGVEIVSVNLLKADPPAQVIDAFRDIQTAKADMVTARNEAEAYRNDILPRARGEAEKLVLDAEAYKQQSIARAGGEAARFKSVYEEYRQSRDVTRRRLYVETMEEILQGVNKVIMDKQASAVPYLPLDQLKSKTREEKK